MATGASGTCLGSTVDAVKLYESISKLSASTKQMFAAKLGYWLGWFSAAGRGGLAEFLKNPKEAIRVFESANVVQNRSNRHLFYSAVVALFAHNAIPTGIFKTKKSLETAQKIWTDIQKANSQVLRDHYTENRPTEKQNSVERVDEIPWTEVLTVRDGLPRGSAERLLMMLYTAMPPVRADYFATQIVFYPSKPTADNYLLIKSLKEMEVVLRDFKTARIYSEIRQKLPSEVCSEVVASLAASPRSWLFATESGEPFERKRFSEWSGRVLTRAMGGKHLNINILRHLFISNVVDFNKPAKELEEIGKAMGHNLSMQKGYQWMNAGDPK